MFDVFEADQSVEILDPKWSRYFISLMEINPEKTVKLLLKNRDSSSE